ncbi:C1q-like domain-containing protein [Paenibacillus tepidiphilus]|uniref:C1q-like domain-containing protein n=1 Tax=Paenibacillus tepidiphilus TaxID=2608683 RepID=UPI0013A558C9|nr:hypothetical protein [Paenibacillus tepidiphilus]
MSRPVRHAKCKTSNNSKVLFKVKKLTNIAQQQAQTQAALQAQLHSQAAALQQFQAAIQNQAQSQQQTGAQLLAQLQSQTQSQKQSEAEFQVQLQAQAQRQAQAQAQLQEQIQTQKQAISDIGNATVSFNNSATEPAASRPSAFKAGMSLFELPVSPGDFLKIPFNLVRFDLDGEFDPAASTFIAKSAGVYLFNISIYFIANNNDAFRGGVSIFINGEPTTSTDSDTENYVQVPPVATAGTIVKNTVIVKLNAGDEVITTFNSNKAGVVVGTNPNTTFAATRFPSPA